MEKHIFRGKPVEDYELLLGLFPDNVKNGFVFGNLITLNDKCYICISAQVKIKGYVNNTTATLIEVDPNTVGEFTSLTDKNNKEIFEGDIVKVKLKEYPSLEEWSEIKQVTYDEKECCYYPMRWKEYCESCDYQCKILFIEIIGNIYDNPKLLKYNIRPNVNAGKLVEPIIVLDNETEEVYVVCPECGNKHDKDELPDYCEACGVKFDYSDMK